MLHAAYLGFSDGQVKLKRISDSEEFKLPLDNLSAADQEFI